MTLPIGILGFAHGHVHAYCRRWREQPELGVRPVAGWDHDADRLARAATDLGIEPAGSAAALLARPDLAAVVIAAETSLHADLVEGAAAAGKAVILQKPLALTLAEADRIVAAVARHRVPFTMAWQMRVDPQNLQIKDLLDRRAFGRVFMVRRRHGLPFCLNPDARDSWHTNARWNRDIWADDASHPIDFIYWLFGLPESVTAELATLHDPATPVDNGIAIFRYPGGPLAEVCCSFTQRAGENTTEIVGELGSLVQNFGDSPSCNVPRPAGAVGLKWYLAAEGRWTASDLPTPATHGERIAGLARPLADFLHGRRPPIATAGEGRDALRMLLACYVASGEGCRVMPADDRIAQV